MADNHSTQKAPLDLINKHYQDVESDDLLSYAIHYAGDIKAQIEKIASVAVAGMSWAGSDNGKGDEIDCVSNSLFRVISDMCATKELTKITDALTVMESRMSPRQGG
ncbi:hypothetical protein LJC19_08210 [Oxalobacter sp. OttesenSCG-928-P03]|nr:hypothetical protein [Oxalobacter sp. OttesenSCG-928-P03]